jgi:hypothetical protein
MPFQLQPVGGNPFMTNQAGLQQNMFGNMAFQGQMMDPTQMATMQPSFAAFQSGGPQQQPMMIGSQLSNMGVVSSPSASARQKQNANARQEYLQEGEYANDDGGDSEAE